MPCSTPAQSQLVVSVVGRWHALYQLLSCNCEPTRLHVRLGSVRKYLLLAVAGGRASWALHAAALGGL